MNRRTISRMTLTAIVPLALVLAGASVACAGRSSLEKATAGGGVPVGDHELSLEVGGEKRSYLLHVPAGLDAKRAVPLVLLFHGGFGTGKGMQEMTGMDEIADREGFITIYPDGEARAWNAGECCGRPQRRDVDDVGFVRALIEKARAELPVDPRRVYAAGMSNGAMFVHRVGCELSDMVAAIGTVSGTIRVANCPTERPVPIIHFHGTADKRVPWEGGTGENSLSGVHTSVPDTISGWQRRDGCSDKSEVVAVHGQVSCESYAPCRDGADVVLCTVRAGGHQWPGGEPVWEKKLGPMTTDISASKAIWDFFKAHPMPAPGQDGAKGD